MPLVWAHAEHVKLRRSLHEERVFDMPPQPVRRYQVNKTGTAFATWRFNNKRRSMPCGKTLRIEALVPTRIHWSDDGWLTSHDVETGDTGMGIHVADLPVNRLPAGATVIFTFYWTNDGRWEGTDYTVQVV
jgi:glucoamylase